MSNPYPNYGKVVLTDNSATLVNALAELDALRGIVVQQGDEINHLNHCISNQENVVLAQKAECERHIQEVDASREAIDRKSAALRVALARLEAIAWPSAETMKVITTIKEAL